MYTDTQTRKIDAQKVSEAIMKAATGTIKVMTSTLEAAKTVAIITHDVLETLKKNGVIVEKPVDTTPATNTREISAESKIAHMACQIIMSDLPTQVIESEPEPAADIDLIYVREGEDLEEGVEDAPKKRGKK